MEHRSFKQKSFINKWPEIKRIKRRRISTTKAGAVANRADEHIFNIFFFFRRRLRLDIYKCLKRVKCKRIPLQGYCLRRWWNLLFILISHYNSIEISFTILDKRFYVEMSNKKSELKKEKDNNEAVMSYKVQKIL